MTLRNLTTYIPQATGRDHPGSLTVATSVFPALGYAETLVLDPTGEDIGKGCCEPTQAAAEAQHAAWVRQTRAGVAR